MSKLFLLGSPSDYEKLENITENDAVYALDYLTYKTLQNLNVKYFFTNSRDSGEEINNVTYLAQNWFRDPKSKTDLTIVAGCSIGTIIARRTTSIFSNWLKVYRQVVHIKKSISFNSVVLPDTYKFLIPLFEVLKLNVKLYDSDKRHFETHSSLKDFAKFKRYPPIHKLSWIARLIQLPFMPYIRKQKRILLFADWTSIEEGKKRNDTLTHYNKNILRGFYFKKNQKLIRLYEEALPKLLPQKLLDEKNISKSISNIQHNFDSYLYKLFKCAANKAFNEGRESIVHALATYRELLRHYRPKILISPSEIHYAYLSAIYTAINENIQTHLLVDGYLTAHDKSLFYKDKSGANYLFDRYYAFGTAHKDLLVDIGIPEEKIIILKFTASASLVKNDEKEDKYDFLILAQYPYMFDPESRWDKSPFLIGELVAEIKRSINSKLRIAIKLKQFGRASEDENDIEVVRYQRIFRDMGLKDIDFLTGHSHQYLNKSKIIIGQLSTTLLESYIIDKPFYIFEPYENGKCDWMLNRSFSYNLKTINRTSAQLINSLNSKSKSNDKNISYIISGEEFSKVKLT